MATPGWTASTAANARLAQGPAGLAGEGIEKGACFVITVEPLATIGLSEGRGTLGSRRTGEREAEWAEMAGLTRLTWTRLSGNHDRAGHGCLHVETRRLRYDNGGAARCCLRSYVTARN